MVPGGFSYGDYLRAGAIARFSPAMEAVAEFARSGGPVLGICNGFQVLCEAGLLPGALLPNDSLRFVCRQVDVEVVNADTPFTRASAAGDGSRSRSSTRPAATTRPSATLDELEANGQVLLRYAAGPEPERLAPGHRRRLQRQGGNVMGLMPHPEHAVDPLTGSADGGVLFASLVAHVDELVATA